MLLGLLKPAPQICFTFVLSLPTYCWFKCNNSIYIETFATTFVVTRLLSSLCLSKKFCFYMLANGSVGLLYLSHSLFYNYFIQFFSLFAFYCSLCIFIMQIYMTNERFIILSWIKWVFFAVCYFASFRIHKLLKVPSKQKKRSSCFFLIFQLKD